MSDMWRYDLVGIGEGMVEFHAEGGFEIGTKVGIGYAGDVVNTLIRASRLGLRTALISKIGQDIFGPAIVRYLKDEGVAHVPASTSPGENGLYFIRLDEKGERSFHYRRRDSAASTLGPGSIDRDILEAARYVLVSGITQAISTSAGSAVAAFADMPQAPSTGVYDPNYRASLWDARGGAPSARRAFERIAPRMAWILPSYPADLPLVGLAENADILSAIRSFAATGARVAMKLGAEGVLICADSRIAQVPATRVDRVVDTTGAGDAWNAGFLCALIRGLDPEVAASKANAEAASALQHHGANPPRRRR